MSNDAVKMARLFDMYGDLTDYIEELEAKLAASYTRAQIEAAVKRALEGAADVAEVLDDPAPAIRALDPAQFIEGDRDG